MIRKASHTPFRFGVAASIIAVLSILIAMAALAQSRWPDQSISKSSIRAASQKPVESSPARSHAGVRKSGHKQPMDGLFQPLFLPVVTLDAGGISPNDVTGPVALADLNGDGKLDMVVPNPCAPNTPPNCIGQLSVFLGNGDGTFQPSVGYSSGAFWADSVVIADVNGDHKPDLIVANSAAVEGVFGDGIISVLLGNGDGTFRPAVTYDSGGVNATSVAVGDINHDGKPDLVVSNNSTADSGVGNVAVLLGNGDGTFQAAVTYDSAGWGTNSVVLSDVNGDGKLDVVISDVCSPQGGGCDGKGVAGVLLGNGDGTLKPIVTYPSGGLTGLSIEVADLNHDGLLDLITFNQCNVGCSSGGIGVLLGNGDGTFQPAVTYPTGGSGGLQGMAVVADVDGDGKPDIVATTTTPTGSGLIGVLLGNGDGTFQPAVIYDSGGGNPNSIASADLTGHHLADILFVECPINGCGTANEQVGILLHVGSVATKTSAVSSLNPSVFGQTVTFTATVTSGSGTPSGTVEFFDGSALLGTGTLTNGSTTNSQSLGAGSHSIVALYQGSLTYNSSLSQPLNQVVNPATTATSLASSGNPILVGHRVSYTATVTPQAGGPMSGTVTFTDGASQYYTDIEGNQATITIKYRTNGVHTVTATYAGDSNNVASTSAPLAEDVQGKTKTHLTTSGSPSLEGQAVTFTATVTSKYGAIPNGEIVTFLDGKNVLGSVPLSGGTAAFTTSSLSVKTHTIKAVYAGDTISRTSNGKVTQVVKAN